MDARICRPFAGLRRAQWTKRPFAAAERVPDPRILDLKLSEEWRLAGYPRSRRLVGVGHMCGHSVCPSNHPASIPRSSMNTAPCHRMKPQSQRARRYTSGRSSRVSRPRLGLFSSSSVLCLNVRLCKHKKRKMQAAKPTTDTPYPRQPIEPAPNIYVLPFGFWASLTSKSYYYLEFDSSMYPFF